MSERVLVTDGDQRAALAVVRSLCAAGYDCIVCSTDRRSLAGGSRGVTKEVITPDALTEPSAFARAVQDVVRSERIDLVIPIAEPAMLALLAVRDEIAPARIPFPDLDTFRRVSDKAAVLSCAEALGIRVPAQQVLTRPEDRLRLDHSVLHFPVVLKPSRSVGENHGLRSRVRVAYAANESELWQRLDSLPAAAYPLLLQQRIIGSGEGVFLLLWEGELVAQAAHRRLREKPPSGGVSVYRESITPPPRLVELSRALLERLGWHGVAMVEYKVDVVTGETYLMEINGRFWGSLQLAIDAGVDFPRLLADLALGRKSVAPTTYRTGVRSRWWWGDVDQLLARLRRSDEALALPRGTPGRWRALADFLVLWRPGDRNEVLRFSDPLPFVRETMKWLRGK